MSENLSIIAGDLSNLEWGELGHAKKVGQVKGRILGG